MIQRASSLVSVVLLLLTFFFSSTANYARSQDPSSGEAAESDPGSKDQEKPASDNKSDTAEKPPAENNAAEPAASSGETLAPSTPAGTAKVVDSNQAAADEQRNVSRMAGTVAGVSFLFVLAYFLTRKKSKPSKG